MQGSPEGAVDDTFGHSSKRKQHFPPSRVEANSPKRPRLEVEENALSLKPNQLGDSWLDASGASAGLSGFDFEVQSSCAVPRISTPDMWSQPDTHMDRNPHLLDCSMDENEIHDAITNSSSDGTKESRVCFGMVCSDLSWHLLNAQKLTFSDM